MRRKKAEERILKIISMILISTMLLGMLTQVFAVTEERAEEKGSEKIGIKEEVIYSEDKRSAEIKFDISEVDSNLFEIIKILDPNQKELDLKKPYFNVKENGKYDFEVSYIKLSNESEEIKTLLFHIVIDNINSDALNSNVENTGNTEDISEPSVVDNKEENITEASAIDNEEQTNEKTEDKLFMPDCTNGEQRDVYVDRASDSNLLGVRWLYATQSSHELSSAAYADMRFEWEVEGAPEKLILEYYALDIQENFDSSKAVKVDVTNRNVYETQVDLRGRHGTRVRYKVTAYDAYGRSHGLESAVQAYNWPSRFDLDNTTFGGIYDVHLRINKVEWSPNDESLNVNITTPQITEQPTGTGKVHERVGEAEYWIGLENRGNNNELAMIDGNSNREFTFKNGVYNNRPAIVYSTVVRLYDGKNYNNINGGGMRAIEGIGLAFAADDQMLTPIYALTYNANKPDGVSGTVTVPGQVEAYAGRNYAALGEPNRLMLTSDDKAYTYAFKGWNTQADGTGTPYKKGDILLANGNITLYAVWTRSEGIKCPYVLNIKDYTLKDGQGNSIKESDDFSISRSDGFDAIRIKNPVFNACLESGSHQLLVEGENPKAVLLLNDIGTNVDVSLNGVIAMNVEAGNAKSLTFKSVNLIGSAGTSDVASLAGLMLKNSIGNVIIQESARVILFNSFNTAEGPSPYWKESTYTDLKLLDLIMNEGVSKATTLRVAGKSVTLPSGASRLVILDNVENTWLSGDIEITNEDGTAKYVRGVAEDSSDTAYLDNRFNNDNLYGNTFALSEESGGRTSAYGIYDKVRLPNAVKQVKVSIPTRMLFNIYTKGSESGDFGFIGPVSKINNKSYSAEDRLTIGSVTKDYARVDSRLDVGFLGTMEKSGEPSGYTLADYSKVTQEEMEQTVEKPRVCLEAVANGDANNRIPITQTDALPVTPVDWFVADRGESSFQLVVPKAFQENPAGKRFYQMPSLLDGGTGEQKVSGYHYLRLAFSVSDAQN